MHYLIISYNRVFLLLAVFLAFFAYAPESHALYWEVARTSRIAPIGFVTNGLPGTVPCTATLVASDVILTSSACYTFGAYFTLTLPGPGVAPIGIIARIPLGSVTVMKLAQDISPLIVPVSFSGLQITLGMLEEIIGWGESFPGDGDFNQSQFFYHSTISAFPKNPICDGDIGAPILVNGSLVGVVIGTTGGVCGQSGYIYMRAFAPSDRNNIIYTIDQLHGVPSCNNVGAVVNGNNVFVNTHFINFDTHSADSQISLDTLGFGHYAVIPPLFDSDMGINLINHVLLPGRHLIRVQVSNRRATRECMGAFDIGRAFASITGCDAVSQNGTCTFTAPQCFGNDRCTYDWKSALAFAPQHSDHQFALLSPIVPALNQHFASLLLGNGRLISFISNLVHTISTLSHK